MYQADAVTTYEEKLNTGHQILPDNKYLHALCIYKHLKIQITRTYNQIYTYFAFFIVVVFVSGMLTCNQQEIP